MRRGAVDGKRRHWRSSRQLKGALEEQWATGIDARAAANDEREALKEEWVTGRGTGGAGGN